MIDDNVTGVEADRQRKVMFETVELMNGAIADLEAQLRTERRLRLATEAEIRLIYNTGSWKITRSARALSGWFVSIRTRRARSRRPNS